MTLRRESKFVKGGPRSSLGRKHGTVAEFIARRGDLGEVTDIRRTPVRGPAGRQNVA